MTVALTLARVALGVLWLHEGFVKLHAGFGRADILLVADGASSNDRVPAYFEFIAAHLLAPTATLAGFAVPLIEVGLGITLVLGILTVPMALASALNLAIYWSSDQLVGQYPVMAVLSAVLLADPESAARFNVGLVRAWREPARVSAAIPSDTGRSADRGFD